jgi:uncharacterized protein (DUF488 family)
VLLLIGIYTSTLLKSCDKRVVIPADKYQESRAVFSKERLKRAELIGTRFVIGNVL